MENILKVLEDNANLTAEQLAVMCNKEVGDIQKIIKQYEKDGVILERDGKIYVRPCDYRFEDPALKASVREENGAYYLDIEASRYAKNVMIEFENAAVEPDENFFDITDGKASVLLLGEKEAIFSETPKLLSVYDVQK